MIKSEKHVKKVPQLIWLLYFLIALFKYMSYIPETIGNILIICLGTLSIIVCVLKTGVNRQNPYILFVLEYTVFGFICFLHNGNMDIQELLWPLGFMGIGLLTLNFRISTKVTGFILYTYGLFIIFKIMECGGVDYIGSRGSRNGISVDIITYLTLYMITAYQEKKSVNVWTILFVMAVCFLGIGRSGIVISILLVGLFIVFKFKNGISSVRSFLLVPAITVLVICIAVILYEYFSEYINLAIGNFKEKGMRSTRLIIWGDYIRKTFSSPENILFGSRISGTRYLDIYNTNLHNSFLMLHCKYGLLGIGTVIIMMVRTIRKLFRDKEYYLLVPLIAVFIRMNLDYTDFNSSMDTVLIFFLLYPYYQKGAAWNDKKRKRKCIEGGSMVYGQ